MDLNEIFVFVKVVQTGSFTQAAKQLGMPNSTVSAKVSSLEMRLGVTLIQRTTRKLNITPEGQAYFRKCVIGLEEIQGAETELAATQGEPQGLLRVTAPADLGSSVLTGLVAEYTKRYPKVSVEVLLTDRVVDLLAEGVDLAIRAGELKDSSLIAKRLGAVYFAPFASPKYLRSSGTPQHPKDLRSHQCIQFIPHGTREWRLRGAKGTATVPMSGRFLISDLNMVKALAVMNNGIALLPTYFCGQEVRAGKLIRILPDWETAHTPVHFVYPEQKFVLPKLSSFISLGTDLIKRTLL